MVDLISENALATLQCKLTKFIKRWLNLPRCCTLATVYHPEVLNLPFLPHCRKQAKLSMVGALEFSSDPTIKECLTLLKDPEFLKRLDIPRDTCTILEAARESPSPRQPLNEKLRRSPPTPGRILEFYPHPPRGPVQIQRHRPPWTPITNLEPSSSGATCWPTVISHPGQYRLPTNPPQPPALAL